MLMSTLPTPKQPVMHVELPDLATNVLYPVYSPNPAIANDTAIETFLRSISGYSDAATFQSLPLILQNELYRFSLEYDKSYPNSARVLVFRDTATPNTRTMNRAVVQGMGHAVRILGRKGQHVVMPVPDSNVNTLVVAYPIEIVDGVTITAKTPMVFIGHFKSQASLLPPAINAAIIREQLDTANAVWEYEPHANTIEQLKTALRTLAPAVETWKSRALAAEARAEAAEALAAEALAAEALAAEARVEAAEARAEAAEATNTLRVEAVANARRAVAVHMAALDTALSDFDQPTQPKV